jgi:hypothetical protein
MESKKAGHVPAIFYLECNKVGVGWALIGRR